MTPECQKVLDQLGTPLSGELLAHAQACPECQEVQRAYELLRSHRAVPSGDVPPLGVPERVASELRKRPRVYRWWWGPVLLGAAYSLLVVAGLLAVGTSSELPMSLRMLGVGLGVASLIGFIVAVAPRSRQARIVLFSVLGVLLVSILWAAPTTYDGDDFWAEGIPCMLVEVFTSLIPIGLGIWLLTRTAFHPIRSLLVPFCAATAGLVVLCFHCSNGLSAHLLVFHLLPWLVLSVVAWLVRARAPSYSYAP
jgi:hypothetical protein